MKLGVTFHVLTAWNPGEARPSPKENHAAKDRLRDELHRRRIQDYSAPGSSPGGDHAEESFAAVGLNREAACELGRMFEQEAIFESASQTLTVVACDHGWTASRLHVTRDSLSADR